MKIVKVIVDELPKSASQCEAEKMALVLPGVNSHLIRVYCKIDLNGTKHSLMSIAEYNVRRCPNCPLVEAEKERER